jgi:hypothetical protein
MLIELDLFLIPQGGHLTYEGEKNLAAPVANDEYRVVDGMAFQICSFCFSGYTRNGEPDLVNIISGAQSANNGISAPRNFIFARPTNDHVRTIGTGRDHSAGPA